MADKPQISEAIVLDKKMDMSLDDIIKMSKNTSKGKRPPRTSNKSRGSWNSVPSQANSFKVQQFMDSRSSVRQGVLAQRRSNFRGNQFPLTTEAARKAAAVPIRNRAVNWNKSRVAAPSVQRKVAEGGFAGKVVLKQRPQTLDALFANMKEQRMRVISQQQTMTNAPGSRGQRRRRQRQQQQRGGGRGGVPVGRAGRVVGNFARQK